MQSMTVDPSSHPNELAGELFAIDTKPATHNWYFTKDEIDNHSPSRKDGITRMSESMMRKSFCSFLKELGMKLEVGPVTTATAMMFCHRFYMRQSLAKNDWKAIATACMFLACKVEDHLHPLRDVVVVAYEITYKGHPSVAEKIRHREVYYKQKDLILGAEKLLLVTIDFDMSIQHAFRPLVSALKNLKISNKEVVKAAWNLLNEWLRTTLCLQYKPHYIAAASLSVAAKLLSFRLPEKEGTAWWMQFDVSLQQLEEVTQHMLRYFKRDGKQKVAQACTNVMKATEKVGSRTNQRTQSSVQSGLAVESDMKMEGAFMDCRVVESPSDKNRLNHTTELHQGMSKEASEKQLSDCCSKIWSVKDSEIAHTSSMKALLESAPGKLDILRLKGAFEKARGVKDAEREVETAAENEGNSDLFIERQLEKALELGDLAAVKKQKVV